jgi:DNA-binding NarL/FixJ family response regulator
VLVGQCCVTDLELSQLLQNFAWIHVDRTATDSDGLASLRVRPGALVILDRNVPVLGGLAFLSDLRREKLRAQVLMRSQKSDCTDILTALRAGAAGCLRQTAPVHELIEAVGRIADGRHYLEPDVAQTLALQFIGKLRWLPRSHPLYDVVGGVDATIAGSERAT